MTEVDNSIRREDNFLNHDPLTGYIRVKVICIFSQGKSFLVGDAYDPEIKQTFYCPPGGRVEFGEHSLEALRREIREELDAEIVCPELLGVLENRFIFNNKQGHEIVFVYQARFQDETLYEKPVFQGIESNGMKYNAMWINIDEIDDSTPPIYPDKLIELIEFKRRGPKT